MTCSAQEIIDVLNHKEKLDHQNCLENAYQTIEKLKVDCSCLLVPKTLTTRSWKKLWISQYSKIEVPLSYITTPDRHEVCRYINIRIYVGDRFIDIECLSNGYRMEYRNPNILSYKDIRQKVCEKIKVYIQSFQVNGNHYYL